MSMVSLTSCSPIRGSITSSAPSNFDYWNTRQWAFHNKSTIALCCVLPKLPNCEYCLVKLQVVTFSRLLLLFRNWGKMGWSTVVLLMKYIFGTQMWRMVWWARSKNIVSEHISLPWWGWLISEFRTFNKQEIVITGLSWKKMVGAIRLLLNHDRCLLDLDRCQKT